MASPRSDAVKVEDPDATRLLRDAAAPAGVRPGADDGRRPRPAGDAGPARLRRRVERRALHGAVGEQPPPGTLSRAGGRHDGTDEACHPPLAPALPRYAHAGPA